MIGRTRIDQLSDEERGRFNEWADRWIETGLRTGPADRERFEAAVRNCYRFAGIPFPEVVVWVPSPLVMAFAAPAAALAIELIEAERRGTLKVSRGAVGGAVDGAVGGAVGDAVDDAAISRAVMETVARSWTAHFGGQLWPGGWWWWGPAFTSFFREVCGLELDGDLWDRGRAYEATVESACWWWPHRRFVMVCERPVEIHRELTNPDVTRGWGSHRLHREDGAAVVWPDGWGVYSWHGVRVPADLIEHPGSITAQRIVDESNVEVRRAMLEKVGYEPLLGVAKSIGRDDYGELLRIDQEDDEPIVLVKVVNSTPEPDGSFKDYILRVDPGCRTPREAVAWTFGVDEYEPAVQT